MFDIVSVISKHTAFLENNLKELNLNQRKSIASAFARFYFLLPEITECIEHYLKIKITEKQFLEDLENDNLHYFTEAVKNTMKKQIRTLLILKNSNPWKSIL